MNNKNPNTNNNNNNNNNSFIENPDLLLSSTNNFFPNTNMNSSFIDSFINIENTSQLEHLQNQQEIKEELIGRFFFKAS
jgi:hypothetical protein